MWSDSETEIDFLNFTDVADTIAEIIIRSKSRPISIGLAGSWGSGKSSMMRLVRRSLEQRQKNQEPNFVFVEFNAWLYQGYDDARAALLEEIAKALEDCANTKQKGIENVKGLLKNVDWLRVAKIGGGSALGLTLGLPPINIAGDLWQMVKAAVTSKIKESGSQDLTKVLAEARDGVLGFLLTNPERSAPREIHAIRENFKKTLAEVGVTLVVLIDDLDRCLPPTTISTLEAMRLFLFLENTSFVIAADDKMIKHAVSKHYQNIDDEVVTNYFDKLVQVPIRVPPLGTQEVRAYLMLLYVEQSQLNSEVKEEIRKEVCSGLANSWSGERVDRNMIEKHFSNLPTELIGRFDTAVRIAPLMTSASQISGNPRLVKRFLNALSIRLAISKVHGVGVDEAVLAKMLLFERCGDVKAYEELTRAIDQDPEGKPRFLSDFETKLAAGESPDLPSLWDGSFAREWLMIEPMLSDLDLRGALHVSREHTPLIMSSDRLSSDATELLSAMLENPNTSDRLGQRLNELSAADLSIVMDRLLDRARLEQEWGTPSILNACLATATADSSQGARLAAFLSERPVTQIKPAIVPKIANQSWASDVFQNWSDYGVNKRVLTAINKVQGDH